MSKKRGFEDKTVLTAIEKIKVAYLHEVRGISQHDLATVYEVNAGRVNEAIKAVRAAVNLEPSHD